MAVIEWTTSIARRPVRVLPGLSTAARRQKSRAGERA
jgi:hypothetical protein